VLAQVADNTQTSGASVPPTGQVNPLTAPPTGQVNPVTAPPTGQVNPSNTTPTGQSTVNNALEEQARQARAARANAGNQPIGGHVIGTLTVDQSGTGRMQQAVEGMQVRDVLGLSIVIYSQSGEPTTTLPPNLDPTIEGEAGKAAGSAPPATSAIGRPANPQSAVAPAQAAPPQGGNSNQPVAAGTIRLISDRRPAAEDGVDAAFNPPVPQPANNTPPVGGNPIR
jgi:hypothetical protein